MKTATQKQAPIVHLLGRAQFKQSDYVLYAVQAEVKGELHGIYEVTVIDGKVTSCTETVSDEVCQGWKYRHTCCHATFVQKHEDARLIERVDTMIAQAQAKRA